jgi:stearoyl-CoA desaturase (Delta-9 desaturase)
MTSGHPHAHADEHEHSFKEKAIITVAVVGPFLGFLFALYLCWNRYVFTSDIVLLAIMYVITSLGVTIGFHRMLTHNGFQAPFWLRRFFLACGCMAIPGIGPQYWASTHIRHHAHSDEEGDPHSPLEGLWHAHIGWMYDRAGNTNVDKYGKHFLEDKDCMWVSKTAWFWALASFAIPFAIGGWTGLLWGGVVRFFFGTHVMWSVNSICHTFGERDFETTDESRNHWLIGMLALGEGWHNNHHAFPESAMHGLRWWQFDLSAYVINTLEKMGLVWDVKRVNPEILYATQDKWAVMQQSLNQMRLDVLAELAKARAELAKRYGWKAVYRWRPKVEEARRLKQIQRIVKRESRMKRHTLDAYLREIKGLVPAAA